ncbi:MAG TPA: ABC transporter permease [Gemmataceae bacterium]|nr:ABC transporter permease [Gemmataceae bacterium]
MAFWILAKKELRLLARDYRALVILVAMPLIFIVVLGISVGEGFGQKPGDKLRVSVVVLDQGLPPGTPNEFLPPDAKKWSDLVLKDLDETADIRVEIIDSLPKAEELVRRGQRAAVLVIGPNFSKRASACSFLAGSQSKPKTIPAGVSPELYTGINPFEREGVRLDLLDVAILKDPTQPTAVSIMTQVAQGPMLRLVLPWMIGRAFETLGKEEFIAKLGETMEIPIIGRPKLGKLLVTVEQRKSVGLSVQEAIREHFKSYDLTAKTWDGLTKTKEKGTGGGTAVYKDEGSGLLKLGSQRYKILVPSYTVMFSFFLVLTIGWLFVAERRQGTLKRLRAAPITRVEILLGKLAPCYIVSVGQGLCLLLAGKFIFQMDWGHEPLLFLPVVLSTSLAAMGLGVLIAAVAKTEAQVAIYGSLLVLVLAGLSGCLMGNRALMTDTMQQVSRVTPLAWSLDAYLQLVNNPDPAIDIVLRACGVLTIFGVGFLAAAWKFMRLD